MNWKKFFAILKLAPAIIGMVHGVETALPGKGLGAHKLNLILDTVSAAAAAAPEIHDAISLGDLQAVTTTITNGTVATLNAAGVFSH